MSRSLAPSKTTAGRLLMPLAEYVGRRVAIDCSTILLDPARSRHVVIADPFSVNDAPCCASRCRVGVLGNRPLPVIVKLGP